MQSLEFKEKLESIYKNHFPDSKFSYSHRSNLYHSVYIRLFLANKEDELSGGYWENDIFSFMFEVDSVTGEFAGDASADYELPDELVLNFHSKHYWIRTESKFKAYESRDLKFRKIKGNVEKILKSFDVICSKIKQSLMEDLNNNLVPDKFKTLVNEKLMNSMEQNYL